MNPIVILYVKCFFALAMGLLISTGVAFNEVKKLHTIANEPYDIKAFLSSTVVSQIMNIAAVFIWMLLLPDVIKEYPKIKDSVYLANIVHISGCALVGWGNSVIILKVFGSGTKLIMNVIDKKTNIADGKPNTNETSK